MKIIEKYWRPEHNQEENCLSEVFHVLNNRRNFRFFYHCFVLFALKINACHSVLIVYCVFTISIVCILGAKRKDTHHANINIFIAHEENFLKINCFDFFFLAILITRKRSICFFIINVLQSNSLFSFLLRTHFFCSSFAVELKLLMCIYYNVYYASFHKIIKHSQWNIFSYKKEISKVFP